MAVDESFSKAHEILDVLKSDKNSKQALALVLLKNPIDFTSLYVGDTCLYRGDPTHLQFQLPQFVVGWGKNGRSPFISQTLPRYFPGYLMTDEQCSKAWPEDYESGHDICFSSSSNDKNVPCDGDEGSPYLVQSQYDYSTVNSDQLIQLAVYYERDANCSALKPGLFVNILPNIEWITEILACTVPGLDYPKSCPQK